VIFFAAGSLPALQADMLRIFSHNALVAEISQDLFTSLSRTLPEKEGIMLCMVLVVFTIADYIIPDPIPFVDEVILTLVSMGVCTRQRRK
jgi:hypothetical protein